MKRFFLLMALLLIGYWIFRHNPPEGAVGPRASINKSGEPSEPEPSAPSPEPSRWGQLRSIIESDNVPIRFYGVVLDESGVPLPGVDGDAPLAPDSGYADEIVLKQNAGPEWWVNADALLYLKTNSGKYAEIKITAYADRGMESSATGRLSLRWNPTGGRAFE